MTRARGKRAWWLLLAAAVAVFDLWTKGLWQYPPVRGAPLLQKVVFDSWLHIRTVMNEGAVWSLPVASDLLRWATWLAVPLIVAWLFWPERARKWESAAKVLILGGAVGNLYDRVRWNAVRDWIDVFFGGKDGWHWPTFNVADMALIGGIGTLLFLSFRDKDPKEAKA